MILATHSLFETFPFQEFLVLRELVSTKCRSSNERFLNFISSKTWRWISTQNAYKQGNGLWLRGKCLYRCVLEWGLWQQREGLKQLHLSHSLHQSGIQAQLSWVLRRRQWHPHSSTLAWKIPWTEEPGRLQSMGSLRIGPDWAISLSLSCIGEGNGTPLQYSCLENPRDGGAWWAVIYGVAQSQTRLKRLSNNLYSRFLIFIFWYLLSILYF